MKNTLAIINLVSCEVIQVVADNFHLERLDAEIVTSEDGFITPLEKLPVYVDSSTLGVRTSKPTSFYTGSDIYQIDVGRTHGSHRTHNEHSNRH